MFVKIHTTGEDTILAACDEDIIGKEFRGDGMRIKVSEGFYKGESVTATGFVERMKSASILNLVGDEVIELAIAEGRVSEESVLKIGEVRHVQAVIM